MSIEDPEQLVDFLAPNLNVDTAQKQALLEELDVEKRLRAVQTSISAQLEIAVGDTVVWKNADDRDHTVVAKDNSFKSGNLSKGDKFEQTFTKAGKYSYACSYHPRMKGVVIVGGG